ncbi:MAG: hypothetical protein FJX72_20840 [Armatimonadetes bacterium]|nr:hypothetical protein [Armatimonadota bacterium]
MFHRFYKGTGAMAVLIDDLTQLGPGDVRLHEVRLHLNGVGGAGNFTIKVDSAEGAEYDSVLNTQDMTAVADELYAPDNPPWIRAKDGILCEWANAGSKTWGLEVIYARA